jgi:peptidoglycan-N-acetylglucosamine deacetylase
MTNQLLGVILGMSLVSCNIQFWTPSHPPPLSPKGARGEEIQSICLNPFLPSPLWGRGAGGEGVSKLKPYSTLAYSLVPGAEMIEQQPVLSATAPSTKAFSWPNGKRGAVSLSFDDARLSQIDTGLALLKEHHIKVTFFVQPENVRQRLEGWKQAVADGHEIGNHSQTHPCTGNYAFSRHNALEDYSLAMMAAQLDEANAEIQSLLGVKPRTFAYPCGLKFVGRGLDVRSYVPLVAERFLLGRGYLDESPNDPEFCDLSQAMGTPFDDLDFEQMKNLVQQAAKNGRWIIFVGHEIGKRGFQVTDTVALAALCDYLNDPANGIWLGTVAEIADYVRQQRPTSSDGGR